MIRSLLAKCWWLLAVVVIMSAVTLTFARLLLPYLGHYQDDVVAWLGRAIGQPLVVDSFRADWHGLGPRFTFSGVQIADAKTGQTRLQLQEASITIDLPRTITTGEVHFGALEVRGVDISFTHRMDGSIAVEHFGSRPADGKVAENTGFILGWLLSQPNLALRHSRVTWNDEEYSDRTLQFVNVNLTLRNSENRHQFNGSAALPSNLGQRFTFAIDVTGNIMDVGGWDAETYVDGAGLQIEQLLSGLPLYGLHVEKGTAEIELWSRWEKSRLTRIDGDVALFSLLLDRTPTDRVNEAATLTDEASLTEYLDTVSGHFTWQRVADGWRLDIGKFVFGRWGEFWPQSDMRVAFSQGTSAPPRLEVDSEYVRLDDLMALLSLTDAHAAPWFNTLSAIQPAGRLSQARLVWENGANLKFRLQSHFDDLSVQAWHRLPALSGIDGNIDVNEEQGSLELNSRAVRFDMPGKFRAPLEFSDVVGDVYWQHRGSDWLVESKSLRIANHDIQVRTNLYIDVPKKGSPYIDLVAGLAGTPGSMANTGRYLPAGVMPPKTVAWLDRALVGGTINGGSVVLRGPLNRFPFDGGEGKFEARLAIAGGILDYLNDWPRIDEIETEVVFSGRQMTINAVTAKTLDTELTSARVTIPDLLARPATVNVDLVARGDTNEVFHFLTASALRKKFGGFADRLSGHGNSKLLLSLSIPLKAHMPIDVKGTLSLADSELDIEQGAVKLDSLYGDVNFTQDGLSAESITGNVMGVSARFDITSDKSSHVTRVNARGQLSSDQLSELVHFDLFREFTGTTPWQASLTVPSAADRQQPLTLDIKSGLQGMKTNLPPPFDKAANDERHVDVVMRFPVAGKYPVDVSVDGVLTARLGFDGNMALARAGIRFPAGEAKLPSVRGVRLEGLVPEFSFTKWWPYISNARSQQQAAGSAINSVAIEVGKLELLGYEFSDIKTNASLSGSVWKGQVDGKQLAGKFQVPVDIRTPLYLDMQRLLLDKPLAQTDANDELDPRELPTVNVTSKQFKYHDIDFGELNLVATRHLAGLSLTDLHLKSSVMDIMARGDWVVVDNHHYSSFNITFSSSNLGKALDRFGYVDSIRNGKSTFDIVARWPGNPAAFALDQLDGNIHMRIEDGSLLDIDPGAGRIFGLLSLQALPRRLVLDFRDVFQKGLSFDRIKGDFLIKDGNAETNNLVLKSPGLRVEAQGRVGLAKQDYDQTVTIYPDVGAGLPVAGAVVSGVGVGAAILIIKELFKSDIEKASQIRYSVKGPWSKPVIRQLSDNADKQKNNKGSGKGSGKSGKQ